MLLSHHSQAPLLCSSDCIRLGNVPGPPGPQEQQVTHARTSRLEQVWLLVSSPVKSGGWTNDLYIRKGWNSPITRGKSQSASNNVQFSFLYRQRLLPAAGASQPRRRKAGPWAPHEVPFLLPEWTGFSPTQKDFIWPDLPFLHLSDELTLWYLSPLPATLCFFHRWFSSFP